ncbi:MULTISPECIES: hypothetical protein [Microbacterium]|uniref:hypothetical protein n=1 Tax=Microbacterium TaxID=33882 RepID=UPI000D656DB6|nr:hypothetical protein [Microbacterium sp. KCTC 39802]
MTSKLRVLTAASAAALLLSLAACASGPATTTTPSPSEDAATSEITTGPCEGDTGVTVIVDGSALEDGSLDQWCVTTDEPIVAADAFSIAAVQTEGTDEYGDQVVCRVNGLPAEDQAIPAEDGSDYFETCEAMPAAFAYWSLWVKPAGGEWGYAQEGASTQELEPGDAVELLFTLNGEPAAPTT